MKNLLQTIAITSSLLLVTPTLAAEVTDAGASQLRQTFERYLGKAAEGQPARVAVTVEGGAYRVAIDAKGIADAIVAFWSKAPVPISLSATPFAIMTTPLDDGTWKVAQTGDFRVTYSIGSQSGTFEEKGIAYEGIYDPTLFAFRSQRYTLASLESQSKVPPDNSSQSTTKDLSATGTATAGPNGTVDAHIVSTTGTTTQTIALPRPAIADGPSTSFLIESKVADRKADFDLKAMRSVELADLLAHVVAHPPQDMTADDQAALKARIAAVLPLFDQFTWYETWGVTTLQSPVGQGTARSMESTVKLVNTAGANSMDLTLKANGVKIDSIFVPAEAASLLPTDLDVGFAFHGYDIASGLSKLLDTADFSKTEIIAKDKLPALLEAWLPQGTLVYDLKPSKIVAASYSIGWFGIVEVQPMHAKAHLDVTATGIDAVIHAIQQLKQPSIASLTVVLYGAKALAKPGADGALTWAIDVVSDHGNTSFLVNGLPVGPQKKQSL